MNKKLHTYQYVFLLFLNCLGSLFLLGILQRSQGVASWVAILCCIPFGVLLNLLGLWFFSRNRELTLYEINVNAFGTIGGKIVTVLYALYFFMTSCVVLNYYGVFTVDLILRDTDLIFFLAPSFLAIAYALRKGLLTIGRIGAFFGTILLVLSVLALFTEWRISDIRNLFPVNIKDKTGFLMAVVAFTYVQFGELFAVFSMINEADSRMRIFKVNLLSILLGNGLIVLFAIADVLALGQTMQLQYAAFYRVIRIIDWGEFMNRIEVLVVSAYFLATIFRVLINLHVVCKSLAQTFGMETEKPLALPVCACAMGFTNMLSGTTFFIIQYIIAVYPYVCTVPFIILPLLTILKSKAVQK